MITTETVGTAVSFYTVGEFRSSVIHLSDLGFCKGGAAECFMAANPPERCVLRQRITGEISSQFYGYRQEICVDDKRMMVIVYAE